MSPAVSVIIPAHDAAAFLADAIASSLAQSLEDIEVIVVDDGSHDATWSIIGAAAAADSRIRPVRRPAAGGPGAARNAALAVARGRWIAPLDADDLFAPDRLRRLVAQAEGFGTDLVADNPERRDYATGRTLGQLLPGPLPEAPLGPLELIQGDMPDQPAAAKLGFLKPLFRREFLTRHGLHYAEDIRVGEDVLLVFACLAMGARMQLLPEPGYVYRIRTGSVSQSGAGTLPLAAANRRMQALAPPEDAALRALLRHRQALLDLDCFSAAVAQGQPAEALRHVTWSSPRLVLRQFRIAAGAIRRRGLAAG